MRHLTGYKAHWIDRNSCAVLSKNSTIYNYNYNDDSLKKIIKLDYDEPFIGIVNKGILERLLRGGIHHVLKVNNNYVIFFNRRIFSLTNTGIQSIFEIKTCKRPLNVCYNPNNGQIYWGDYIAGSDRLPINIYCSKDVGQSWEIVHTFPAGKIRHIHNIIYDPFQNQYWILTGDTNLESGIWSTKDFKEISPVLHGDQKYRATSLIPQKDGLIIPTDTEFENNYIQYYSYLEKTLNSLFNISSSSIDARQINNFSFVSTMIEPSTINKSKMVKLYVSLNNKDWIELLSIKKGFLPGKYFQYPSISIPIYDYEYVSDNYYFNIRNTRKDNGVIILSKNEMMNLIA